MLRRTSWWVCELSGALAKGGVADEVMVEGREWPPLPDVPLLPGQCLRVKVDFIVPLPDSEGRKLYLTAASRGLVPSHRSDPDDPVPWDEMSAEKRQAWEDLAAGRWK